MQVYGLHNPCRYVFVASYGPVVLFDFKGCGHLSRGYPAVDEARDMIAFDSDLIGPHGYSADISRSWIAGDRKASDEQRRLYELAYKQIQFNIELFRPGSSFREVSEAAFALPDPYSEFAIPCVAHGVGLCNEYPLVMHRDHWESGGYDDEIRENMVFCVESYVGDPQGDEGVKLEEQVLVTKDGPVLLSSYPFETWML